MFEEDELRLLWPFYISITLTMALFISMAYWVIYFKDFLSFTQLSVLMAIMFVTPIFFEVPTGIIADIYGRKFSTLLGYFSHAVLFILVAYTTNYIALVILFILFGISGTLFSGAENAWAVDWLIKNKKKNLQKVYFRRKTFLSNVGQFIAAFVGIITVKYFPFMLIWVISGIGFFLGALILLFGKEHFKRKKTKVKQVFTDLVATTKKGFKYTISHKKLHHFTIFFTLIWGISAMAMTSWEPELKAIGLPVHLFGLTLILGSLFGILISLFYHHLTERMGHMKTLFLGGFFVVGIYLISYFVYQPYIFLLLFSLQYAMWSSYYYPISYDYLHNQYSSKIRATLESITNLMSMLGMALFLVIGGFLNDLYGPRVMILVTGVSLFLFFTLFSSIDLNGEKKKRKKKEHTRQSLCS